MKAQTVPSALRLHHNFCKGQRRGTNPAPVLPAAVRADGAGGEAAPRLPGAAGSHPSGVDSPVLFEAGSCCFPLNWLSDENLVMLLSPHLWLQNVQPCCTLCTGGVMLAHVVTHGHCPCTTCHARVLAFLSSATPDVLQFYTHKGRGFASV